MGLLPTSQGLWRAYLPGAGSLGLLGVLPTSQGLWRAYLAGAGSLGLLGVLPTSQGAGSWSICHAYKKKQHLVGIGPASSHTWV